MTEGHGIYSLYAFYSTISFIISQGVKSTFGQTYIFNTLSYWHKWYAKPDAWFNSLIREIAWLIKRNNRIRILRQKSFNQQIRCLLGVLPITRGSYYNNQFYKKSRNLLKYLEVYFVFSCKWREVGKKGRERGLWGNFPCCLAITNAGFVTEKETLLSKVILGCLPDVLESWTR